MIKYYRKSSVDSEINVLEKAKDGIWVYVEDPTEEEIEKLSNRFDLDDGHLTDATDPYEIPRLEIEDGVPYIFTRAPYTDEGEVLSTPILFVLGDDFIMTVCQEKLPLFNKFIDNKIDFSTTLKIEFFAKIFSEINNVYNLTLKNINKKIYKFTANIEHISNKDITHLIRYEQTSNDLLSRLTQINSVLSVLQKGRVIKLDEDDKDLMEDVYLANGQLIEITKNTLQSVKNIRDSYSTILTNNLNRVMRLLTTFTIILTIPTIFGGLWGMNVAVPFQDSPYAFYYVIGIIVTLCSLVFWIFKKKDLL